MDEFGSPEHEVIYDPTLTDSTLKPVGTRKQIGAGTQIGGMGLRSTLPAGFGTFEATSSQDIALFLNALLLVVAEPKWRNQFSSPGVHEWFYGTLDTQWNAARERALATLFPRGTARMFYGDNKRRARVDAEVNAAGQQALLDWMVKSKLVSNSDKPLQWLMLLITNSLGRPSHDRYELADLIREYSAAPPASELLPGLVLIQHLERLPTEKRVDWKRRMLAQLEAARKRREQRVTAKRAERPSEVCNPGNNHKALILALCGIGWKRIFEHYRERPGCTWKSRNSAQRGAEEFAKNLGLKLPLRMPKSGRPRKEVKSAVAQ